MNEPDKDEMLKGAAIYLTMNRLGRKRAHEGTDLEWDAAYRAVCDDMATFARGYYGVSREIER